MAYTLGELAWLLAKLQEHGVNSVVIGSTVVDLLLQKKLFEDDIDLFVVEPSPLVDEEFYRALGENEGWELSFTVVGTPKFVAKLPRGEEVIIELYENVLDFYIPLEIIESAPRRRIDGVEARFIRLEDYMVLKAKAGRDTDTEDLRIIKEYIDEGRLKVDEKIIKRDLELLPEEDRAFVASKLRELGFRV